MGETNRIIEAAADLPELYPGYETKWIDTTIGKIFVRIGGSGPPLLLLHGYAQTNVMWHLVAPSLAKQFTLVIADLPGYGNSDVPRAAPDHSPYTKRAMGGAMAQVMASLGFEKFRIAGHDRGGRVAYRLAFDQPRRIEKLAVLDVLPIWSVWQTMNAASAYKIWSWNYLALPEPFPETMIGQDPIYYWDFKTRTMTKDQSLAVFDPRALEHYRAFFRQPARIHATCEDYRAGRTTDYAIDALDHDLGNKITCPLFVIWATSGAAQAETSDPIATWREWAVDVHGCPIESGHFLAEENPDATATALLSFFTGS